MSTLDKMQLDNLITQLVERGASDLVLSIGSPAMLKIGDTLVPANDEILTAIKIEELVFILITAEQKELLIKQKSLVFSYTFDNGLRFKINLFYQKNSLAASLRFIVPNVPQLKDLGLPRQVEEVFEFKSGLVILCGPQGSGRSTTMAAVVEHLNQTQALRIITIEEPVEVMLMNKKSIIQQREVGRDTPNFNVGLEDCLDSDVEVVAVTQVSSKEELEKILELTQQGKLVLAITNGNSVYDVLLKLIDLFSEEEQGRIRDLLSRALQMIICQRLVPGGGEKKGTYLMVPEILFKTEAVRLSIQDNKLNQINNILRTSAQQGMVSFEQSLAVLVKNGAIETADALPYVKNDADFRQLVNE